MDFNEAITLKMCELLDIDSPLAADDGIMRGGVGEQSDLSMPVDDFREAIRPKHPLPDADFVPRRYYQVFEQKHGFLPNLSILDLLMNMGNESVLYL